MMGYKSLLLFVVCIKEVEPRAAWLEAHTESTENTEPLARRSQRTPWAVLGKRPNLYAKLHLRPVGDFTQFFRGRRWKC